MTILGERIVLFLGVALMMTSGCTTEEKDCIVPDTVIKTSTEVCQCQCMTYTTSTSTAVF